MSLHVKMNEYLANQQVMFIKLHNLHWYIKGHGFFTLHAKLEELYDATASVIDEVAERMLMIGASPVGSVSGALKIAKVKELEDKPVGSDEAVKILEKDVQWWIKETKDVIATAQSDGDDVTADMFTGYLSHYEKLLWMVGAYLD